MNDDGMQGLSEDRSVFEDTSGFVSWLLAELERGPFAPALAGDALARFGISLKLGDFIKAHLAGRVVLIADQYFSPVGRPALALASRANDPAYWGGYRLASLYRVWDGVRVDMDSMTRQHREDVDFAKQFRVGLRVHGCVVRKSYNVPGFIVEVSVNGGVTPCFLPSDMAPNEFRDNPESLLGSEAEFEIVSVLPIKRSVLLRMIRLLRQENKPSKSETSDAKNADLERRLVLARSLLEKGLITQAQYEAKQREILADL